MLRKNIFATLIVILMLGAASAQTDKQGVPGYTDPLRTDLEKKNDREIDRAYQSTVKTLSDTEKKKSDPWGDIRPPPPANPAFRRFPRPWSVEQQDACFVVRDHSGQALIKGTAVLQDYLPIGPHLPMRTPHEQAATHGGRFRPRYESQATAHHHGAENQRRPKRRLFR